MFQYVHYEVDYGPEKENKAALLKKEAQLAAAASKTSDNDQVNMFPPQVLLWECSGSMVECLTCDQGAVGSSLTGITVFCP